MDIVTIAAWVIVGHAIAGFFANVVSPLIESAIKAHDRRGRLKLHDKWVAARRAARLETEERMRREGYWDNFEIQAAMKRAGDQVDPGHRV
jgi:hypothetical protein